MSAKSIILLVVGLGFLTAAAVSVWQTSQFIRGSERSEGRVAALNAGGSHPQIAFTTKSGDIVSFPQSGLIAGFKPGDRVGVLYRATDPRASATVDNFGALWAVPLVLTFFAACFVIGAVQSRSTNVVQGGRYG